MSSSYVRTQIKSFFAAQFPAETLVDYTAEERQLSQVIKAYGIDWQDDWYAIEFIGSEEEPITVPATNTEGKYREFGTLFFHIVTPAGVNAADTIVTNAELVRNAFRGQRINDIMIDSVTPVNTNRGATLEFEQGFTAGSFFVAYRRDLNL